ncbi:MAG TPA: hypothetical protein PK726_02610 [Candidatus Cloacimonadota bacterium]|nr:hypothetical protein [Candidatus Cloacimonadota bacterium]
MRYILYRVGAEPAEVELDEAVELAELYTEEAGARFCPFMGAGA